MCGVLPLQAAVAKSDLGNHCVDMAETHGLVVGQLVHSRQGHVNTISGMVNGQNVDGLAIVRGRPASSALYVGQYVSGREASKEWAREKGSLRLPNSSPQQPGHHRCGGSA